ncbi:MAG: 1-deoxy-D-xylulose-5-phosphate reductoisomerase [Zetaproteobacteria bacterium CG_4_9_14_3_um_filter_49_83]|nr:MAG: 1-deoxy-D-xylulose-5-phosphate reductoisomerase [Zetaproteobacteria bacterium CG17_big_fil_post_rev_8_21_14_2_50_50_13]PIV31231.1 MAG: 1-deoxy-D-xylulose-5-phosphate reductoisomerase [Zetaproteobacteria bacterium CG02_land_8_20_14_3_00_50_9]PIY56944.1 MAG: 1-deoxy-D-xylulose-5-phosphate reductoisomerase [Zetaproteobacteria bacterium CG_4_10_14_0_8_um_filter_49_80]PJA35341.1 MAG: 1-deoxy-D-xylulose-5-phosphate reductoisomerase [Zetaproteobacteria bacterium CG_4_9_14_3_um_filter_49_83]
MMKVTILGATGSIGLSTVDVMMRHPDRFSAYALVAHKNWQKMLELASQLQPEVIVMTDPEAAEALSRAITLPVRIESGMDAAIAVSEHPDVDMVMAAMVGSAGLPAALAAVRAGKRVGLANKECLVTAGRLFMQAAIDAGADVVPVDSEHAAVHQAMVGHDRDSVTRVILTASGGPFRDRDPSSLHDVTPEEAIAHPNWSMGAKISVDSATMLNKALELIEARWLFDMPAEKLSAIIHPQSIVHALVEYRDGSVLAQLAEPDMRSPIVYAMQAHQRLHSGIPWLDLAKVGTLEFRAVDELQFPAMRMVQDVMRGEDSLSIAMNAANEVANEAFRGRKIRFTRIVPVIEEVLSKVKNIPVDNLEMVWSLDHEARVLAQEVMHD